MTPNKSQMKPSPDLSQINNEQVRSQFKQKLINFNVSNKKTHLDNKVEDELTPSKKDEIIKDVKPSNTKLLFHNTIKDDDNLHNVNPSANIILKDTHNKNVLVNTNKELSFNHSLNFSSNKGHETLRCSDDRTEGINCISKIENKMFQDGTNNNKNNST